MIIRNLQKKYYLNFLLNPHSWYHLKSHKIDIFFSVSFYINGGGEGGGGGGGEEGGCGGSSSSSDENPLQ